MIYLKNNTVGIDTQIQWVQQHLYDKLVASLNCEVHAYGRVYVDTNKNSTKPLAYIGNGDYRELLINDKIRGLHFFFVENDESDIVLRTCMSSNEVDIIFLVDDLRKVRTDISHYADEEIKEEVKSYLRGFFDVISVTKGIKALDGFDVSKLKFIYPYYAFKIKIKINNY